MKREFIILLTSLMLIGLLGTVSMSQEDGTWTQKADMPTARYLAGSAVVDGKIYVIGGAPVYQGITAVVEEYDPAADTWTRRSDMPTARQGVRAAAVDGRIYAFGGNTIFGKSAGIVPTVEVYDPATDTWTQASDMSLPRHHHAASVVDGKIYIFGGNNRQPVGFYISPVVDVYDPATDTWTTAADLPTPRWVATTSVVDGKIYTIGGRLGSQPGFAILSIVEEYGPGLPGALTSVSPGGKLLETWGQIKKAQ